MTMKRNSMLKQALREAGLDIYRVSSEEVQLAERVRDNLIMDARISVRETLVRFSARARQGDFPEDEGETLFNRARKLGEFARSHGFEEARQFVTETPDPSNPGKSLDAWYEVEFAKKVENVERAIDEARFVLRHPRKATR